MVMTRKEKEGEVENLVERFKTSPIAICADYQGLTVDKINGLRNSLREADSEGKVVKNKLAKISVEKSFEDAEKAELEKFTALFSGPSLVIFGREGAVSSAKALQAFADENEQLEIKGGWLDGAFLEPEAIKALSKMPSKVELQSQLLSVLNAPATKVVQLLSAPASQLVRLLAAYRDKLEAEGK